MLYWMCKKSQSRPLTWPQMKHAIMRNFGGLKSDEFDPFDEFDKRLNMAEEEPDPEEYVNAQEVAINNQFSCFIIFLAYSRLAKVHKRYAIIIRDTVPPCRVCVHKNKY